MRTIDHFTTIGRTLKVHGLGGEILLQIEDVYMDTFLDADFIFLKLNGSRVPFYIENVTETTGLIVKLADVTDPGEASKLIPADVSLPFHVESIGPGTIKDLKYQWAVGYQISADDHPIGEILRIESYPQQELAIVSHQGMEILIPMHHDLIKNIDNDSKMIYMQLPEGLLDIKNL